MHAQHPSRALRQHRAIAVRLGGLHDAKGIRPSWERDIVGVRTGHLEAHPGRGSTLVRLSGRVEETRPESDGRGDPPSVTHVVPQSLERDQMPLASLDIGQDG